MNDHLGLDRLIGDWLEAAPPSAPVVLLPMVLAAVPSIPQRRGLRVAWMPTISRGFARWSLVAATAFVGVVAVGGLLWLGGTSAPSVGGPTPSTAPRATVDGEGGPDPRSGLVPDVVVGHWVGTWYTTDGRVRHELFLEPDAVSVRRLDGAEALVMVGAAGRGAEWEVIEFGPTSVCETSGRYGWIIERDDPAVRALVLKPIVEDCEARRSLLEGRWPAADSRDVPGLFPDEWGESLEGGRHSLTVDGIPFSFSVPPQVPDAGWARYGDLYISKHSTRGQAAEAVVYWTAFPDGALADRCGALSQPVGPSIDDLANLVAVAPHAKLVAGPSDMTVGGRPAKYIVLTVSDDLGCDPGFFYTWLYQPGGPGWWGTDAGDTINVWIVDVRGRRLVIVGESTWDAGPALGDEIPQIVDSIRFE